MNRILLNCSPAILALLFIFQWAIAQDPARFQWEIDQFKKDTAVYSGKENLILFTGSSTIRMWNSLAADFPGRHVLNRGFGGSHMSDLLFYADTLVLRYQPELVFIYEGDNDLADGKSPRDILATASSLVDRIRSELPETDIVFFPAKPSLARWNLKDSFEEYNRRLKDFTEKHSRVFYLDTWSPMLGPDGKPRKDIFIDDGLHMNRKGYDIWADVVREYLGRVT